MAMLKIFQYVATTAGGSDNVDPTMMGVNAQRKAYTCKQKENQSNAEYLQAFMQLSRTARFCDYPMGASLSRLVKKKTGKSDPTLAELKAVEEKIVEKEMAMVFILGADKKQYGSYCPGQ
ncbi:unnamed protein product [Cylindrotheca closterium]|uniref:Uncharacterized protein n=1 Tax=Cylindrotheca closterium TaxID=2856 RepID=A0AAD2G7I5_9STRA|nr:unnamed protein product [Cylindrotheca closterium]